MKQLITAVSTVALIASAAIAGGEVSGGGIMNWDQVLQIGIDGGIWEGDCTIALVPEGVTCIQTGGPFRASNRSVTFEIPTDLLTTPAPDDSTPVGLPGIGIFVPPGYIYVVGPTGPILIPVLIDPFDP
jgi:hypothetical protein